ncbi:hypothetical protein [Streptomyces sp. NPDC047097]|uniref:hypothetical protein n=1 Tax=Streptomyces sp. NPDC047097 TaxID=3155260 RepID=UPI0033E36FE6
MSGSGQDAEQRYRRDAAEATEAGCDRCRELRAEATQAERWGDYSRAVDCRIYITRHPVHDGRPDDDAETAED